MPQKPMTEEEQREKELEMQRRIRDANEMRTQELGEVLGLHEDFIRALQERGPVEFVNRAESVDVSGVQGLILTIALEYGTWMQETTHSREKAPSVDEKVDVMAKLSRRHDIDPRATIFVLGTMEEQFDEAASQLRQHSIGRKMDDREELREEIRDEPK